MSMKEDVINMKKQVEEIKKDNPETFAMSMFKENSKLTKKLFTIIYILVGIIALFVGGIVYFVTNYDIGVKNTTTTQETNTSNGNACIGNNCANGDIE